MDCITRDIREAAEGLYEKACVIRRRLKEVTEGVADIQEAAVGKTNIIKDKRVRAEEDRSVSKEIPSLATLLSDTLVCIDELEDFVAVFKRELS